MLLSPSEVESLQRDAELDAKSGNTGPLHWYKRERERARALYQRMQEMDDIYTTAYYRAK